MVIYTSSVMFELKQASLYRIFIFILIQSEPLKFLYAHCLNFTGSISKNGQEEFCFASLFSDPLHVPFRTD